MFFTPIESTSERSLQRSAYEASKQFLFCYVKPLSEDESQADWWKRLEQTPTPTVAKGIVDRILDGLRDRLRFAVRYGQLVDEIESDRGADNYGATVNDLLLQVAEELEIADKVGVLVNNAVFENLKIDEALSSHVHCCVVKAENIQKVEYAPAGSRSVFSLVEIGNWSGDKSLRIKLDIDRVVYETFEGDAVDAPTVTDLTAIPFILAEREGTMSKLARHQVALSNLQSVLATESPAMLMQFLARQDADTTIGGKLTRNVQVGKDRGVWYDRGEQPPVFVAPESGPIGEARQLAAAIADEMESIAGLAGAAESDRKAALANVVGGLGALLFSVERQIWQYVASYHNDRVALPAVRPPRTWQSQSETERQDDIEKLFANAQRVSGRAAMEAATVLAVEQLFAGQESREIAAAVAAVRKAPILANNLAEVVRAYEANGLPTEVFCDAFGCLPIVAVAAKREAKQKRQELAEAAALATAEKPADSIGSDRDAQVAEKRLSQKAGGENLTRDTNR